MELSNESLHWAKRLVRINTVSRESNLALIECIADHLRGLGVALRLTYDDARRKANLFATLGAGKPDGVILSGHTDTVPWDGQAWTLDPLGAVVRDGRLYGRGSADMKAFIGLVVAQTERFLAADLPHAIHYAFSFDEEVGCFGVAHLIADLREAGIAPTLCLVGEPTGMVPAVAHKGVYRWRCCIKGKPAHSSLRPQAVNAIEAGARLIAHIAAMGDEWQAQGPRYEGFDVPVTTSCVGVVQGGIADNVVPEDCSFHYEFRNLPGHDAMAAHERVVAQARSIEVPMKAIDAATGIRFETICAVPDFLARADEPAVRLAQRLVGEPRTTLVAFGTEAGLFHRAGISTVVCGPGPRRTGAPARRIRESRAARSLRGRAARTDRARLAGDQPSATASRSHLRARASSPSARASAARRRQQSRLASPPRAGDAAARSSGVRALPQRPRSA